MTATSAYSWWLHAVISTMIPTAPNLRTIARKRAAVRMGLPSVSSLRRRLIDSRLSCENGPSVDIGSVVAAKECFPMRTNRQVALADGLDSESLRPAGLSDAAPSRDSSFFKSQAVRGQLAGLVPPKGPAARPVRRGGGRSSSAPLPKKRREQRRPADSGAGSGAGTGDGGPKPIRCTSTGQCVNLQLRERRAYDHQRHRLRPCGA